METESIVIMVECLPESASIKENCSSIDDETDAKHERWINRQLDSGNQWAWCTIQVTVNFNGKKGKTCLGCCSYRSYNDFKNGGYYEDMVSEAFGNIFQEK